VVVRAMTSLSLNGKARGGIATANFGSTCWLTTPPAIAS
jgi:hypothetical protein